MRDGVAVVLNSSVVVKRGRVERKGRGLELSGKRGLRQVRIA